jgi:uncharacterized phage-associated protein
MLLDFNIDKAIAATAYIIERDGGKSDMFPLIKKLYYSDRSALVAWGNSVTGDSLASLEKGPIVSTIYNLLKGQGKEEDQIKWDSVIQRNQPYSISLRKEANIGVLSQRELEMLEESRKTINAIRGSIPDWLHRNCPEWENPGRSSSPIDPSTILRLSEKTEEEIQRLEQANEERRFIHALLSAR